MSVIVGPNLLLWYDTFMLKILKFDIQKWSVIIRGLTCTGTTGLFVFYLWHKVAIKRMLFRLLLYKKKRKKEKEKHTEMIALYVLITYTFSYITKCWA